MVLNEPYYLLLMFLLIPMLWLGNTRRKSVGHSQVSIHARISGVSFFRQFTIVMLVLSWSAICLALARPLLPQSEERQSIQTRDIVVQVDISGSMRETIGSSRNGINPAPASGESETGNEPTRIDAAQNAVRSFVLQREGDRVALLLFSDETFYAWPLSRDLSVVLSRAGSLDRYVMGGTNFDGSNGALQGAIDHFREMSQAQTRVLVLVTDGEASLQQARVAELKRQIQELGIRVYVLGVGPGWVENSRLTQGMLQLVEEVGGTVIIVSNEAELREGFANINDLERSSVEVELSTTYRELYPMLTALAALSLLAYLALGALILEDS